MGTPQSSQTAKGRTTSGDGTLRPLQPATSRPTRTLMMQAYIDNKEERDRNFVANLSKYDTEAPLPENEGTGGDNESTPPNKNVKDDSHDRDPPDRPTKKARVKRGAEVAAALADAAADMDAAEALKPATLAVVPQYGGIPCGEEISMKALIKATPVASAKPKIAEIVLLLDESMSMGSRQNPESAVSLLSKFCTDLFTYGVVDMQLHLRVLLFGGEVVDKQISNTDLVVLNDKTRDKFLAIAAELDGRQGTTNIGGPVMRGIEILKSHREQMMNCIESGSATESDLAPVQHVIAFTDGCPNVGVMSGSVLHDNIKEAVGDSNIFVHFVGLGGGINPSYITSAIADGKFGVFASAPDAKDIAAAYEEVFGFALATRMSFTVKIEDAQTEPRIEKLGLLIKERSVLVDVTAPNNSTSGDHTWLKVTLMSNGETLEISESVSSKWHTGKEPTDPTDDVKDLLEREEIEQKMLEVQRTSHSIDHASRRMQTMTDEAMHEGAYGAAALHRMTAMSSKIKDEAAAYRSLGARASEIYSAKSRTQTAYE